MIKKAQVKVVRHWHRQLFIKITNLEIVIGDVTSVTLSVNNRTAIFIGKIVKYGSSYGIHIPKAIIQRLGINKGDFVEIKKIHKISFLRRTKRLFKDGKIDLLFLIPKTTRKQEKIYIDFFNKSGEEWIKIWYPRTASQAELKRYINLEKFGNLLGQLQAEGTKFKNNKTPFLSFTNKLMSEHCDFINSLKILGIPCQSIKIQSSYNPNRVSLNEIKSYTKKLIETTSVPFVTYIHQNKGAYKFRTYVYNVIIAEILLSAMDKIRKILADANELKDNLEYLAKSFLTKLFTGDGTLQIYEYARKTVRNKLTNTHIIWGHICDKDLEYREDYKQILKKLGFGVRDSGCNRIYFSCRLENLIFLLKIKAFKGNRNWYKLLNAIKIHCQGKNLYGRSLLRLWKLKKYTNFSIMDVCNTGCKYRATISWLFRMRREGCIKRIKKGYNFTSKAKEYIKLLDYWQTEFTKFHKRCK